jgi:hypothetical protein
LDNERVSNVKTEIDLSRPASYILKVGRRRFLRITIG